MSILLTLVLLVLFLVWIEEGVILVHMWRCQFSKYHVMYHDAFGFFLVFIGSVLWIATIPIACFLLGNGGIIQ